jgi:hypothetical protein
MLYLLAQTVTPSNPWISGASGLVGALIGASAALGGHFLVHHLRVKNEQRQRLIDAHARFAGSCYRFISHCQEVRAALEAFDLLDETPPPPTGGIADYEHEVQLIKVATRENAIKEKAKALDAMAAARAELVILVGQNKTAVASIQTIYQQTFDARNSDSKGLYAQQLNLDAWLNDTIARLFAPQKE